MLYQIEKYNIPRFLKLDKLLKRKDLIVGNIEQHTNANIRCISIRARMKGILNFVNLKVFFFLMIRKENNTIVCRRRKDNLRFIWIPVMHAPLGSCYVISPHKWYRVSSMLGCTEVSLNQFVCYVFVVNGHYMELVLVCTITFCWWSCNSRLLKVITASKSDTVKICHSVIFSSNA